MATLELTNEVVVPEKRAIHEDDLFRIPVAMFNRMVDRGLLKPDDRVELIHGLLVKKWR